MRIVKDADGDLWEEIGPGDFQILFTQDDDVPVIDGLNSGFGPFTVYGQTPFYF